MHIVAAGKLRTIHLSMSSSDSSASHEIIGRTQGEDGSPASGGEGMGSRAIQAADHPRVAGYALGSAGLRRVCCEQRPDRTSMVLAVAP